MPPKIHTSFGLLCTLLFALSISACSDEATSSQDETWDWALPDHFPSPRKMSDNPMSEAKFQLGRHLFYDTRLSYDETMSCASCHKQEHAFADDVDLSTGVTGEIGVRTSMPLFNVAYVSTLNWANPLITRIEDQVLGPMYGTHPVEMGSPEIDVLQTRLRNAQDADYNALFNEAFPEKSGEITTQTITYALASFVRGLTSSSAPIDAYFAGDPTAISDAAKRGMNMFNSERFECFHCHGGSLFTSSMNHAGSIEPERGFHNNGLYNIDGEGAYPPHNPGVFEITRKPEDMGRFRAPSLRNIKATAPYMHDGSVLTLDDVLDMYARGGRLIEDGPYAGDGAQSPFRSQFIPGFRLLEEERADFHAFFDALTDESFLNDPRYASPFAQERP